MRKARLPALRLLWCRYGTNDLSTTGKIFSVVALSEHTLAAWRSAIHEGGHCRYDIFKPRVVRGHDFGESWPAKEVVRVCCPNLERAIVVDDGNASSRAVGTAARHHAAGQLRDGRRHGSARQGAIDIDRTEQRVIHGAQGSWDGEVGSVVNAFPDTTR
jgi:hypothetical protein